MEATSKSAAERWSLVTARDLMRTDVVVLHYATPLSEIERTFSENRISGAPVTDEAGRIVGIVSLKDLIERYAENPDSRPRRGHGFYHLSSEETLDDDFDSFDVPQESEDTAETVMTALVHTVPPDAGLRQIATEMAKHHIHRLLVAENGKHLGLISTTEILQVLSA